MKMLLSADRIRAIVADVRTEKDLELSLRSHKIRFSYDTSAGFFAFRVPVRSGAVLVYRTCSRSAPFTVRSAPASGPAPVGYPFPVPRYSWDD